MVESPLENERELHRSNSNPSPTVLRGNPKWGYFPSLVRGLGAEAPEERGGSRCPRPLRVAWTRGKAQEQGAFPCDVPPH